MLAVIIFSKSQKRRVGGSKKHEIKLMWPNGALAAQSNYKIMVLIKKIAVNHTNQRQS